LDLEHLIDALGEAPPKLDLRAHELQYPRAHTVERHGPDIEYHRGDPQAGPRTIEGRIHGDAPWPTVENWSYQWTSHRAMNDTVNRLLREHWEEAKYLLATHPRPELTLDAGRAIGQGFFNSGMYGAGPRAGVQHQTSFVRIRLRLLRRDPPDWFVETAFPIGLPSK
ncbi:MAG: hypothetical protein KC620_08185, partial [Myxococcales bacterium]|nr:hypothetical protein [Myxococcales bacterium]